MRVIQISDTHVSATQDYFAHNRDGVTAWLATAEADLIINTGDVSMNGAVAPADLETAARWHASLPAPVLSVPGNHDIGDLASIRPEQVINDERIARYRALIGPDYWSHDIPGWRLIGLDALLFGSGHRVEEEQYEWLADAVADAGNIALFMHKPLFIDQPGEPDRGYWTVKNGPRQRLFEILDGRLVRLVASGHLHIGRTLLHGETNHVWGPSSAFICGGIQEDLGGVRKIGTVVHTFSETAVTSEIVRPDNVADSLLDPVIDSLYPPHA